MVPALTQADLCECQAKSQDLVTNKQTPPRSGTGRGGVILGSRNDNGCCKPEPEPGEELLPSPLPPM